jgi:hypothetical protein
MRIYIIVILLVGFSITLTTYVLLNLPKISQPAPIVISKNMPDKFGTLAVYPTKQNGREWYVDMQNPNGDGVFNPGSEIQGQSDGSWQVGLNVSRNGYGQVRMNVRTPAGLDEWKDVEITGYAKVLNASNEDDALVWYARGNRHNNLVPCEGTSLKGGISADGTISWVKEIWHTGGYTDERGKRKVAESIIGKWIGWKVVIYNINEKSTNRTIVKMESYLDYNAENKWVKVAEEVDRGGWEASSSDSVFYSANCGRPRDFIITNSYRVAAFRSDNMIWNFQNLSVREIQAP